MLGIECGLLTFRVWNREVRSERDFDMEEQMIKFIGRRRSIRGSRRAEWALLRD